jgi:hypothetical protein
MLIPVEISPSLHPAMSLGHKVKAWLTNVDPLRGLRELMRLLNAFAQFLRLNYITGAEVARQIGVRDTTLYSWLQGESRPANPKLISAFLASLSIESSSGISPTGYEYREYKNWRGIPKPRRCPFCKNAKGEIRKVRGGHQTVCANCGATGPNDETYDKGLRAWNGRNSEARMLNAKSP